MIVLLMAPGTGDSTSEDRHDIQTRAILGEGSMNIYLSILFSFIKFARILIVTILLVTSVASHPTTALFRLGIVMISKVARK